MFKRLSTELALAHAILFAAALIVIAAVAWLAHLAPDPSIVMAVGLIGAGGLASLVVASWLMSRRIAGPISALHAAASRLATGEPSDVKVEGRNEIAELASSFNAMSVEIAARERRIIHLAQHDNETGLPNQRALQNHLGELRH
jgi:HAMP domain-containing protein